MELYNSREKLKEGILRVVGTDLNGFVLDDAEAAERRISAKEEGGVAGASCLRGASIYKPVQPLCLTAVLPMKELRLTFVLDPVQTAIVIHYGQIGRMATGLPCSGAQKSIASLRHEPALACRLENGVPLPATTHLVP